MDRARARPRPMCGGCGAVRPRGRGAVRLRGPSERAQHMAPGGTGRVCPSDVDHKLLLTRLL